MTFSGHVKLQTAHSNACLLSHEWLKETHKVNKIHLNYCSLVTE